MKPHKQNQIIFFFPDIKVGGVEKNFFIISKYLSNYFNKIYLITSNSSQYKRNSKIKLIKINNFWFNLNRKFAFFICSLKLFFFCHKYKKSVIFSFQGNFYALLVSIILKRKIIIRSNLSPSAWSGSFFKKKIFYFLLKNADKIIVNSNDFQKEFKKTFKINPLLIYNPIDPKQTKNKSYYQKKINFFKNDTINLINVGRLVDQKNQIEILNAINLLKEKVNKFRLLIIGYGYNESNLKEYIKKNKLNQFIKIIRSNNALKYIKMSDVFILSSKSEGLPNVLLESASLNKFIISTSCKTGPKEIIQDYKYGKLYKSGNPKQLSNLLLKLNKEKLKKNKINYSNNLKKYNCSDNLKKYYKMIEDLI